MVEIICVKRLVNKQDLLIDLLNKLQELLDKFDSQFAFYKKKLVIHVNFPPSGMQ